MCKDVGLFLLRRKFTLEQGTKSYCICKMRQATQFHLWDGSERSRRQPHLPVHKANIHFFSFHASLILFLCFQFDFYFILDNSLIYQCCVSFRYIAKWFSYTYIHSFSWVLLDKNTRLHNVTYKHYMTKPHTPSCNLPSWSRSPPFTRTLINAVISVMLCLEWFPSPLPFSTIQSLLFFQITAQENFPLEIFADPSN